MLVSALTSILPLLGSVAASLSFETNRHPVCNGQAVNSLAGFTLTNVQDSGASCNSISGSPVSFYSGTVGSVTVYIGCFAVPPNSPTMVCCGESAAYAGQHGYESCSST